MFNFWEHVDNWFHLEMYLKATVKLLHSKCKDFVLEHIYVPVAQIWRLIQFEYLEQHAFGCEHAGVAHRKRR